MKTVLWWGRFDSNYSRNGILRRLFRELGYHVVDFRPAFSRLVQLEAGIRGLSRPDLVWVPCFRHRDILSARGWADKQNVPVLFDPLISAWDKQVFERQKFAKDSIAANRLFRKEQRQFQCADLVIADTEAHASFFCDTFTLQPENVKVIHVGADESLFKPDNCTNANDGFIHVLFYGSFISLQGPETIVNAARLCDDKSIRWHMLGSGPLLQSCKNMAENMDNIEFEDWIEYPQLPNRIHKADILLGIFGTSDKAERVIPNKVYQSLACGRPVITRRSPAYPDELASDAQSGLSLIKPGNPDDLVDTVRILTGDRKRLQVLGRNARANYEKYFSNAAIRSELESALSAALNR